MKYGNGKFETCGNYAKIAEWLYSTSDGGIGSVDELGWYDRFEGKIKGHGPFYAIISEDSQGFVDVEWFDTPEQLNKEWDDIERAYATESDDDSNGGSF